MESKKKITRCFRLAAKILSGLALYFSICILITAANNVISAGKDGFGYLFLILGSIFLVVQFLLATHAANSIFSEHHSGCLPIAMKVLASAPLYLSLLILAYYAEDIVSPITATVGYAVVFSGMLLVVLQLSLAVYSIGSLLEKSCAKSSERK